MLTLVRPRPLRPLALRRPQAFAPPPTPKRADAMPRRAPRQPAAQAVPAAPVLPCPRPLQACRHAICAARGGFTLPHVQLPAESAEEHRAECLEAAALLRRLATAACAAGRTRATCTRRRSKRASSADSSTRPASVSLPEAEPVRRRPRLWVDA